jgi:hypothetical protein
LRCGGGTSINANAFGFADTALLLLLLAGG